MPEQDFGAGELEEGAKVLDVVFPASDEASGVVEPGEEAFDLPTPAIAAEGAAILAGPVPGAIRRDHLNAVLIAQLRVQDVAVVAAIAD